MAGDLFCVEVEGRRPNGQTDVASKYVPIASYDRDGKKRHLTGQNLANAYAKAETGAKRRLTFSMVGLAAPPDVEDVEGVRYAVVDAHGNVVEHPTAEQKYLAEHPTAARVIGEPTFETTADPADAPIEGASQSATADEIARPAPADGPRPTFKPSEEERERWRKAWFASVTGTSLADDDERHRFFRAYTHGRTESSTDFFATATQRQAEECLAHTKAIADEEKAARAAVDDVPDDGLSEDERPF
jgi:hypothetical protein